MSKTTKGVDRQRLRWRLTRRDIYEEEGYMIESIAFVNPPDSPRNAWTLRGHFTRNELLGLKDALVGALCHCDDPNGCECEPEQKEET